MSALIANVMKLRHRVVPHLMRHRIMVDGLVLSIMVNGLCLGNPVVLMRRGVILLRRAARVRTGARVATVVVSARLAVGLTVILLG